tara:strand:+ start:734 stop:1015 length:282 start_codon:yes stop_codon:yes gene_type:complete
MEVKTVQLKKYFEVSDCMYTNILIASKRARQIIDQRYERVIFEKNIEDTDQLEALIDEEDFNAAKPIDQAMEEMLENELDWRISDLEKDNLDE